MEGEGANTSKNEAMLGKAAVACMNALTAHIYKYMN
jgi:hypothetical protein